MLSILKLLQWKNHKQWCLGKGFLKATHVQAALTAFENPTFCFVVMKGKDQSYESAVGLTQQIEQAWQSIRGPDNIWFKSQIQHLQQKCNKKSS